jgi:O-antigen/teichoic acid export membrane protein
MSGAETRGLRSGFLWIAAGNAFYAATQWATLSLIAKLGSAEMLGTYALALSIAMPVSMLAHLNLRSVLATDVSHRHPFGDYLAVRLAVSAICLLVLAAVALTAPQAWAATMLAGLALAVENVSDLYHGALQRRDRLDRIARSLIARGLLSVLALAPVLWMTRDLLRGIVAMLGVRVAVLLLYDRPSAADAEEHARTTAQEQWTIFRTALPLGLVLTLISLNANLPRYAVEHYYGSAELGAFAAAASFITVGTTAVNALGQSTISRLARQFTAGDFAGFRRLALRMAALPLVAGVCGVVIAAMFGKLVLALLYRPEFAVYDRLLVAMMAASTFMYMGSTVGYIVTSLRAFAPQLPLFAAAAACCAAASWLLIPRIGLYGGAAALAISATVQIAGNLVILRRRLRQAQSASV